MREKNSGFVLFSLILRDFSGLYFLLYWPRFSCGVSGENLCNCKNLLHSGFCLGWSVVFLW